MRRHALAALLLAAASLAGVHTATAQPALGAALQVPIDGSVRVGFTGAARDLVVANPMIADVTLLDGSSAVVLGKEYGQTTVVAYDAAGRTVFSRRVVVVSNDENHVAYFRGGQVENYACGAKCERTPMLGETSQSYGAGASSYSGYAARVSQGAQASQ